MHEVITTENFNCYPSKYKCDKIFYICKKNKNGTYSALRMWTIEKGFSDAKGIFTKGCFEIIEPARILTPTK